MFPVIKTGFTKHDTASLFKESPEIRTDRKGLEEWVLINEFGKYIVSFIDDTVHSVIFQIEHPEKKDREEKYYFLLGQFQMGSKWKFLADNGTGYLFEREDKALFASYSYLMDIWSFHTAEYRTYKKD